MNKKFDQRELFKDSLIDTLFEGAYFVDRDRRITFWNKAAERMTGYTADRVVGHHCRDNLLCHVADNGKQLCLNACPLAATMSDGQVRQAEVFMHHQDGHRVPVLVRVAPVRNEQGEIIGAVELFTEKGSPQGWLMEVEHLKDEVFKDALTQIANRKFAFMQHERYRMEWTARVKSLGLLMIDIDHFKVVNDSCGHAVGDKVLVMVAKTIENTIRSIDTAVRWGGEEFLVLLPNLSLEPLERVAERIRAQVENCWIDLGGDGRVSVTVSIGGALMEGDETLDNLVDRVDRLLYQAKRDGRNRVVVKAIRLEGIEPPF